MTSRINLFLEGKALPRRLLSLLILAFFLTPMMSVGVAIEGPRFVEVAASPSIHYEDVSGMVKNGSVVSISVVLTNFSKEIEGGKSELVLYSGLENPVWGVSMDGKDRTSPYVVDHRRVKEVRIALTGEAPEVKKRTEITLLSITQRIKEEYPVICIKEYATSEIIEAAIRKINETKGSIEDAKGVIASATAAGVDVSGAKTSFALANEYLNNSLSRYNEGKPEEALKDAELALVSAKEAADKARAAIEGKTKRNVAIIAAVVVIAIVAVLLLIQKRRRERGIF